MKEWGIGLWVLSGVLLAFSFFMETTAPYSSTLNIGRMQEQLLFWQAGLALIPAGAVLFAVGELIEHLKKMQAGPTNESDSSADPDYIEPGAC